MVLSCAVIAAKHDSGGADHRGLRAQSVATTASSWKDVWEKKGKLAGQSHELNGFTQLNETQWRRVVCTITKPLAHEFTSEARIIDVGCGAGAFLETLITCDGRRVSKSQLYGVDYSQSLIDRARERFSNPSHFNTADMRDLSGLETASFDVVFSFSTFFYLPDEAAVVQAVRELLRIAKPGGLMFIADVSDKDKEQLALQLRGQSRYYSEKQRKLGPKDLSHTYVDKNVFRALATEFNLQLNVIDEVDLGLVDIYEPTQYRYTVSMRVPPSQS